MSSRIKGIFRKYKQESRESLQLHQLHTGDFQLEAPNRELNTQHLPLKSPAQTQIYSHITCLFQLEKKTGLSRVANVNRRGTTWLGSAWSSSGKRVNVSWVESAYFFVFLDTIDLFNRLVRGLQQYSNKTATNSLWWCGSMGSWELFYLLLNNKQTMQNWLVPLHHKLPKQTVK